MFKNDSIKMFRGYYDYSSINFYKYSPTDTNTNLHTHHRDHHWRKVLKCGTNNDKSSN